MHRKTFLVLSTLILLFSSPGLSIADTSIGTYSTPQLLQMIEVRREKIANLDKQIQRLESTASWNLTIGPFTDRGAYELTMQKIYEKQELKYKQEKAIERIEQIIGDRKKAYEERKAALHNSRQNHHKTQRGPTKSQSNRISTTPNVTKSIKSTPVRSDPTKKTTSKSTPKSSHTMTLTPTGK